MELSRNRISPRSASIMWETIENKQLPIMKKVFVLRSEQLKRSNIYFCIMEVIVTLQYIPADKWTYPYSSTIFWHWVPFPEPGAPKTNTTFGFSSGLVAVGDIINIYEVYSLFKQDSLRAEEYNTSKFLSINKEMSEKFWLDGRANVYLVQSTLSRFLRVVV